jgi:hypothetical protein
MPKKITLKQAMEKAQVNRAILSQDADIEERRLHHIIEGTVEATHAEQVFITDVLGLHVDDIAWPTATEEKDQDSKAAKNGDDMQSSSEVTKADQGSRQNFLEGIMDRMQDN